MQTIPTDAVLRPVIDKHHPGMQIDEFINNHISLALLERRKSPREVVALSYLKITTYASNDSKALELNADVVESYRSYKFDEGGFHTLLEARKHQINASEIVEQNAKIDVKIFEEALIENNYIGLREIPTSRLRLLITTYSKYQDELISRINQNLIAKADMGEIHVLTYPRIQNVVDPRTTKEKFSIMFFAFIGSIIGGIFLIVQYEKNWPDYKKSIEKYLQGFGIQLNHKGEVLSPEHQFNVDGQNEKDELGKINTELESLRRKVVHK